MYKRFLVWAMAFAIIHPVRAEVAAPSSTTEEPKDWPAIILKLRQQRDHWPGHAETRRQLAIAHNNYGIALSEQGQFEDAVRQVEEARRLDPANAQFRTNLARIHVHVAQNAFQARQVQDAKRSVEQALAVDPNIAQAYWILGEIEYNSQRLKEAKAAWEQALVLDPSLNQAKERLERLQRELPVESKFERLSQAYFDIRYTGDLERNTSFDMQNALLEARRSVGADFAYWHKHKLIVLVYTAQQFRHLRGETPDWLAGQYDGKIRVPLPGQGFDRNQVMQTLVHEYTHAVVHDVTRDRLPTWLNEGLAEYEAWKGEEPPWPSLRQAVENGTLVAWDSLSEQFSATLPTESVMLGYEQSHSIVRYLVQRYGFWRIRRILQAVTNGTPFETALTTELHRKLPRLQSDWRAWLEETLQSS